MCVCVCVCVCVSLCAFLHVFFDMLRSFYCEVVLQGGQVRIRNAKHSISSVSVDLIFDKFLSVESVADAGKVTAKPRLSKVQQLVASGRVGDVACVFLSREDNVEIMSKKGT